MPGPESAEVRALSGRRAGHHLKNNPALLATNDWRLALSPDLAEPIQGLPRLRVLDPLGGLRLALANFKRDPTDRQNQENLATAYVRVELSRLRSAAEVELKEIPEMVR